MPTIGRTEIWRSVAVRGEPGRADNLLRSFARVEGEAVFCRRCDGSGLVLAAGPTLDPIRKCSRCGGEGLEPPE